MITDICLRRLHRLVNEARVLQEKLAEKGVAEFSPWDADTWRKRFSELGETLPDDVKDWFKVLSQSSIYLDWDVPVHVWRTRACAISADPFLSMP